MERNIDDFERLIKNMKINPDESEDNTSLRRIKEVRRTSFCAFTRKKSTIVVEKADSLQSKKSISDELQVRREIPRRTEDVLGSSGMQMHMKSTRPPLTDERKVEAKPSQVVTSTSNGESQARREIPRITEVSSGSSRMQMYMKSTQAPLTDSRKVESESSRVVTSTPDGESQVRREIPRRTEVSSRMQLNSSTYANKTSTDTVIKKSPNIGESHLQNNQSDIRKRGTIKSPVVKIETFTIPRGHERYKNLSKSDEEIDRLVDMISKNINKRISREEKKLRKSFQKNKNTTTIQNDKKKKTIKKPKKSKVQQRLTAPKERGFFKRLLLRWEYNAGFFKYLEEKYFDGTITPEEVEESKSGTNRKETKLYREVQKYEDVVGDVKMKNGWIAFKVGLVAMLLATSIGATVHLANEVKEMISGPQIVTLENAGTIRVEKAKEKLSSVLQNTDYEYNKLSEDELLDAVIRIPLVENKKGVYQYKNTIYDRTDQELLEKILEEVYMDEYDTFSFEKKVELKQLAYELLDKEKQIYIRNPQKVAESNANQLENDKNSEQTSVNNNEDQVEMGE